MPSRFGPTIFVIYDFTTPGNLPDQLHAAREKARQTGDFSLDYPDSGEARAGEIWRNNVEPRIADCDWLLAYVDLPNANVAFEIGFALGRGKPVALARKAAARPSWTEIAPLHGFHCNRLQNRDEILTLLRNEKAFFSGPVRPAPGNSTLILCPPSEVPTYEDVIRRIHLPGLQMISTLHGWNIHQFPQKLHGIGRVIWFILPAKDAEPRDGAENAALAVVAGYLQGIGGIEFQVFVHSGARGLADIAGREIPFDGLEELLCILEGTAVPALRDLPSPQSQSPQRCPDESEFTREDLRTADDFRQFFASLDPVVVAVLDHSRVSIDLRASLRCLPTHIAARVRCSEVGAIQALYDVGSLTALPVLIAFKTSRPGKREPGPETGSSPSPLGVTLERQIEALLE